MRASAGGSWGGIWCWNGGSWLELVGINAWCGCGRLYVEKLQQYMQRVWTNKSNKVTGLTFEEALVGEQSEAGAQCIEQVGDEGIRIMQVVVKDLRRSGSRWCLRWGRSGVVVRIVATVYKVPVASVRCRVMRGVFMRMCLLL